MNIARKLTPKSRLLLLTEVLFLSLFLAVGCGKGGDDNDGGGGGGNGNNFIDNPDVVDTVDRLLNTSLLVSASYDNTCAIKERDSGLRDLKCWGNNHVGQLGLGDDFDHRGDEPGEMGDNLPAVDLGTDVTVISVYAGSAYMCALAQRSSGKRFVTCWGSRSFGVLGRGDDKQSTATGDERHEVDFGTDEAGDDLNILSLAVGERHNCVILEAKASGKHLLKCWGDNGESSEHGKLGLGVHYGNSWGDEPGEMGDDLPAIPLGTYKGETLSPVQMALGTSHTCVLGKIPSGEHAIKCWGANKYGELGLGHTDNQGHTKESAPAKLDPVLLGTYKGEDIDPIFVAAGFDHTCALGKIPSGEQVLKCWGRNTYGELGYGDKGDKKSRGGDPSTVPAELDPVVMGTESDPLEPVYVTLGGEFSCAFAKRTGGEVVLKCWGRNSFGKLGLGIESGTLHADLVTKPDPAKIDPVNLDFEGKPTEAQSIDVAHNHVCVISKVAANDFILRCWGHNAKGKLGFGNKEVSYGETPETTPDKIAPVSL